MKFCVSLFVVCLLSISVPSFATAKDNDPPVLTATSTADGAIVTVTGTVSDESPSSVQVFVYGGPGVPDPISVDSNGSFSTTIEIPPFVTELTVVAVDDENQTDFFTIYL